MILDKIVAYKKKQIQEEKEACSLVALEEKLHCAKLDDTKDFYEVLRRPDRISIIAEVKKASPSKGIICEDFHPVRIAETYVKNDVEAISVLTEKEFFMGSDEFLKKIRQNVSAPLLRKDFIIDSWQIYQARLLGADAILLIVAILDDKKLKEFYHIATQLGLHCLVEVHDEEELHRALAAGVNIVGINNRNLKTFETSLQTTERLIKQMPNDVVLVSESGIHQYEDMQLLQELGVDAVLIGEALMRSGDIGGKIKTLRTGEGRR